MAVIATQSNYSMGQHRGVYSSPNGSSETTSQSNTLNTYRTDVSVLSGGPYFAIKNSEKDDSLPFRDPLIRPDTEFQAGTTYFLRLQINRHAFKDMTYAIKLIKPDSYKDKYGFYDEKKYQYLKRVTVNSSSSENGNDENVAVVTVYKIKDDPVRYFSSMSSDNSVSESQEGIEFFEIKESKINNNIDSPSFVNLKYNGKKELSSIGSFKISLLENSSSESAEIVEILFTPTENYSAIVIEKERDNSDWTTFFEKIEEKPSTEGESDTVKEKKTFNGFETSIRSDVKIYSLKNLLKITEGEDSAIAAKPNKISKIGVWGRSNLCLNCNGEEIRIGPRGYYEMSFDETLGLSSFGVLAESESDFPFLIDYEYILS